jgi:hypothetical protein
MEIGLGPIVLQTGERQSDQIIKISDVVSVGLIQRVRDWWVVVSSRRFMLAKHSDKQQ